MGSSSVRIVLHSGGIRDGQHGAGQRDRGERILCVRDPGGGGGRDRCDSRRDACQKVRDALGTQFCRRCNYCAPCTVGISIPSVFLFQGYLNRYGLQQWGRERYATLQTKAGACIRCGACEPRCPYDLPIRQMMQKAAEDFGE